MLNSIRLTVLPALGLFGVLATSATPAQAFDRSITLVNHSQHTITSFFASNVSRSTWEEDILGDREVAPGQSIEINLNDGSGYCRFDFKTVLDNKLSVTRNRVDVCTVTTYTIND